MNTAVYKNDTFLYHILTNWHLNLNNTHFKAKKVWTLKRTLYLIQIRPKPGCECLGTKDVPLTASESPPPTPISIFFCCENFAFFNEGRFSWRLLLLLICWRVVVVVAVVLLFDSLFTLKRGRINETLFIEIK